MRQKKSQYSRRDRLFSLFFFYPWWSSAAVTLLQHQSSIILPSLAYVHTALHDPSGSFFIALGEARWRKWRGRIFVSHHKCSSVARKTQFFFFFFSFILAKNHPPPPCVLPRSFLCIDVLLPKPISSRFINMILKLYSIHTCLYI